MGFGLRRRAVPLFHLLRHLPTATGARAYASWIDQTRQRHARQTEAAFDRALAGLDRDSIALDLGANLGDFTERLAATGAQVHSFEPEPRLFSALQARFAGRDNVTLHNAAVAARAGMVELQLETTITDDSLTCQSHSIVPGGRLTEGGEAIAVNCIDLFDFVAGLGRRPALTKMDIEGAEVEILERMIAEGRMDAFGRMFVETHERQLPDLVPRIVRIFRHVRANRLDHVNLFWP